MKFLVAVVALVTAALAAEVQSNVVEVDGSNFADHVGVGKVPAFVEFYAPWCGHCKNLAPIYEELADAFAHAKGKVQIVKIDADGNKDIASKYGVRGYPTLKWFDGVNEDPEAYEGEREFVPMAAFITRKSKIHSRVKAPPPSAILQSNVHDFQEVVMDPSRHALVAFTAPWCGHCKAMKPHLEKVATAFIPEKDCVIVNVDADGEANADLAEKYEVKGFPTIKFFPKDGKDAPIPYDGPRDEAAFIEFLNEHCGTQRVPGGGLNDQAGRLSKFDLLVEELIWNSEDPGARAKSLILEEVRREVENAKDLGGHALFAAKWYLRAMEKTAEDAGVWLAKESKRLTSILSKKSLAASKLDELQIKVNILKAFVKEQVEEATEKVEKKVKDEL